ncbi:hypothetical protein J1N35_001485 [Gossypium stocksii]|uniref:Uncharacterized protein n=1 Tax=Gossypium stocksii TaxID=47602 RepID=A0A9D3WHS4_9ROSI|nr:hypothetical protein J1N35_001485 [Gossypium stocksii]
MNAQQKPITSDKDYMIIIMIYFAEVTNNETNLDQNTQIDMIFKSLSKDFASFQVAYNLGNKTLTLTQLMKELQSYELMLNVSQLVRSVANIVVSSSSKGEGKRTKKDNATVSRPSQVERKIIRKSKDLSKSICFFCSKKGHFKANYK